LNSWSFSFDIDSDSGLIEVYFETSEAFKLFLRLFVLWAVLFLKEVREIADLLRLFYSFFILFFKEVVEDLIEVLDFFDKKL